MIHRLGNPEPFCSESMTLGEHPQLSMAPGQVGTGGHGGQENPAKTLTALPLVKRSDRLSEADDRSTIVTLIPVRLPEAEMRQRVQDDLSTSRGRREGTQGGGDSLVIH